MTDKSYIDIEETKTLKARYCRLSDTKQWALWRDVFTEDFKGTFELPPNPASVFNNADEQWHIASIHLPRLQVEILDTGAVN
jgi:hypothetical protein